MSYLQNNSLEALEMQKNLLDLLATHEFSNTELALQLIESGGMLPIFVLPLWANYYDSSAKTQLKIRKHIKNILPQEILSIILGVKLQDFYDISSTDLITVFEKLCENENALFTWEDIVEWIFPKLSDRMEICEYFIHKKNIDTKKIMQKMIQNNSISFCYAELEILPIELFSFKNLESIVIDYSKITQMQNDFFELKDLKTFSYEKTPLQKNRKFNQLLRINNPKLVAQTLYNVAKSDYWIGRYKTAAKKIEKCIKIFPHSAEFWNWHGEINRMANFLKESEKGFKESLKIEYNNSFAIVKLAEVVCNLGKYQESISLCDDFFTNINNYPKNTEIESDAWFVKGLSLFYLKKYEDALYCNDKSIKINNYSAAWYNKACSYSKINLKKEMLFHLRKSFELDYNDYYNLAVKDVDKDFDGFYTDEDFKALLKEFK